MKPHINTQVTNLGVAHKIDGVVVDITDTAMQRQTRKESIRKVHDRRIVREAVGILRWGHTPQAVLDYIDREVTISERMIDRSA